MLSKKDVSTFVERSRNDALMEIENQYEKAVQAERRRNIQDSQVIPQIQIIQGLVWQAEKENEKLIEILSKTSSLKYEPNSYCGLSHYLKEIRNVEKLVMKNIIFLSPELLRLDKVNEETKRKVKANYAAVQAEVKNKTNAKRAVEYLRELGFDVAPLEKMQNTEIAVLLDTRYLFINKAEGEG